MRSSPHCSSLAARLRPRPDLPKAHRQYAESRRRWSAQQHESSDDAPHNDELGLTRAHAHVAWASIISAPCSRTRDPGPNAGRSRHSWRLRLANRSWYRPSAPYVSEPWPLPRTCQQAGVRRVKDNATLRVGRRVPCFASSRRSADHHGPRRHHRRSSGLLQRVRTQGYAIARSVAVQQKCGAYRP